jgi:uncharacterized protein YfaP (DUF2135 family)
LVPAARSSATCSRMKSLADAGSDDKTDKLPAAYPAPGVDCGAAPATRAQITGR